jgi:hypothetical protein
MGTESVWLWQGCISSCTTNLTVVDTTVFGGRQLLDGNFSVDFVIGSNASNSLMTLTVDMTFTIPNLCREQQLQSECLQEHLLCRYYGT